MKGVNKGPGKAATNRAFTDSDEDSGNHSALMMMQGTTTTPEIQFPQPLYTQSPLAFCIYSVLLTIKMNFERRIRFFVLICTIYNRNR